MKKDFWLDIFFTLKENYDNPSVETLYDKYYKLNASAAIHLASY